MKDKKLIRCNIDLKEIYLDSDGQVDFNEFIDSCKKEGITKIEINADVSDNFWFYLIRPETDRELSSRLEHEAYMKDYWERNDREKYEQLKKRFQ